MTIRLSSEDAVTAVGNRFDLVLMSAQRIKELRKGAIPRVTTYKSVVSTALAEIEQGKYTHVDYEKAIKLKKKNSNEN